MDGSTLAIVIPCCLVFGIAVAALAVRSQLRREHRFLSGVIDALAESSPLSGQIDNRRSRWRGRWRGRELTIAARCDHRLEFDLDIFVPCTAQDPFYIPGSDRVLFTNKAELDQAIRLSTEAIGDESIVQALESLSADARFRSMVSRDALYNSKFVDLPGQENVRRKDSPIKYLMLGLGEKDKAVKEETERLTPRFLADQIDLLFAVSDRLSR